MGELAPASSPWIPEDDLLLKNAVEAGASLEALAKGAVCFSRQFTLTELQHRWFSLLYVRDISTEASARILEIGNSVYSKSSKTSSFKLKDSLSEKRKLSSLRSHYHALRKRAYTVSCNYGGSEFNMPPAIGHVNGNNVFADHVNAEVRLDSGQDAFPEMQRTCAVASAVDGGSCAFNIGHMDSDAAHAYHSLPSFQTDHMIVESLDHNSPDDTSNRNRICGHNDDISQLQRDKAEGEGLPQNCGKKDDHNDGSHIFGDRDFQSQPHAHEIVSLPNLSLSNHFEANMETKSTCASGQGNNAQKKICASFGENQNIKSEDMDCTDSFQRSDCSTPLPEIPLWTATHDTTMQVTSTAGKFKGKEYVVTQPIPSDNCDGSNLPEFDGALQEPSLCDEIVFGPSDERGDFMDISLNFMNVGESFLFDVNDKGIIDKSCFDGLNNFLMSSSSDDHQESHQEPIHDKTETNTADILNTCRGVSHVVSTGESNESGKQKLPERGDVGNPTDSTFSPDNSSKVLCHYGPLQGPIVCVLNTEDPDIPCNDDVVLPPKGIGLFSLTDLGPKCKNNSLLDSSNIFMDERNAASFDNIEEAQEASQHNLTCAVTQLCPPQTCPRQKPELQHLEGASSAGVPNNARKDSKSVTTGETNAPFSAAVNAPNHDTVICAGQHANFRRFKDSSIEKIEGSYYDEVPQLNASNVSMKEIEKPVLICSPPHAEVDLGQIGYQGQVQTALTSDQDEKFSDNDDLPCFSDVEAMILDMDLCPDEQESFYFAREVSRYRHMDTKKTIIRLEQGVYSYIQRAIELNGAFAVFYGRHLKYYINKYQVLIGRGTQEICVDIDLQNEGRANKISRRQAVIQMDNNGAFSIRNIGKFAIHVNDKELLTGKCCSLPSGCLIEIRGMSFVFEANCKCVRRYLSNNSGRDSRI